MLSIRDVKIDVASLGEKNLLTTVTPVYEIGKHGGGDNEIMRHLVDYLRTGVPTLSLTSIDDSVEGHLCVYAAEISRKEERTVRLSEIRD